MQGAEAHVSILWHFSKVWVRTEMFCNEMHVVAENGFSVSLFASSTYLHNLPLTSEE